MLNPILVLVMTQVLFTGSDVWARSVMVGHAFALATFIKPWFIGYVVLRTVATFGQLYVLSTVPVGKTMAIFGATSIVLVNLASWLLLREVLGVREYLGVAIAILAFIVLAWR